MANSAGVITIKMRAGTAELFTDIDRSKAKIREFGTAGVGAHRAVISETKATKAAFKALEGGMLDNSRAAEQFAEKLLGVGGMARFAFPLLGGLAFGGMIVEIGQKVAEFFKGLKEAPEKINHAFRDLVTPMRTANDELRVANDRLFNDISKLSGHGQNPLKLMLDEAVVSADKLGASLEKALESLVKVTKENEVGFWGKVMGAARTDDIGKELGGESGSGGFTERVRRINEGAVEEISAAARSNNLAAQKSAQTKRNTALQIEYNTAIEKYNKLIAVAVERAKPHQEKGSMFRIPGEDNEARLSKLRGSRAALVAQRAFIDLSAVNQSGEQQKEVLTAGGPALAARKAIEGELLALGIARLSADNQLIANAQTKLRDLAREGVLTQHIAGLVQARLFLERTALIRKEQGPARYDQSPNNTSFQAYYAPKPDAEAPDQAGGEARSEAARQFAIYGVRMRMSKESTNAQIADLARLRQLGETALNVELERQQILSAAYRTAADVRDAAIDRINQRLVAAGGASDGVRAFFLDMERQAISAASIVHTALSQAFEGVSGNLTELMTGGKTGFGKMFGDIGKGMLNSTIKNGMQAGISAIGQKLGLGSLTKADGSSESSALWVRFAGMPGLPAAAGAAGAIGSGIAGEVSKGKGGIWGSIFGAIFGGARGSGGPVSPSSAYLVGERGPEILMGASGRIASNAESRQMQGAGGGSYYSIDARGTDPAQTEQRVRAALIAVHGSAIATSFQVQQEYLKRSPQR